MPALRYAVCIARLFVLPVLEEVTGNLALHASTEVRTLRCKSVLGASTRNCTMLLLACLITGCLSGGIGF